MLSFFFCDWVKFAEVLRQSSLYLQSSLKFQVFCLLWDIYWVGIIYVKTMRVMKHWNQGPRDIEESPPLESSGTISTALKQEFGLDDLQVSVPA